MHCAVPLPAVCDGCGAQAPDDARFCPQCAQPLSVAAAPAAGRSSAELSPRISTRLTEQILRSKSAVEGERKQVTVMFADVQGSMDLAEQLDAEEWSAIMQRFYSILADGVERFEGFVDKFTGDGIMALFGAPIAHEDHAQRACYTALHLRDEITRYATEVRREHGIGFSARIGINSGEVIVGTIGMSGDDLRMDYTAQGHTVGLAQRMETLAEPGSCFVSAATTALVGGYFVLDDLGEFRVKGVAEPVGVHRLQGLGDARTRFDVSRSRGLSSFVGREADLRGLSDALEQAVAGNGQAIGIVAEAGTGKSRLCFEFLEHCRERGIRVFEARAVAHGRNIPFLPILEVFRAYFGVTADDDDGAARVKIAGHLTVLGADAVESLLTVYDFLGVADPENPGPRVEPEIRQRQLVGVMRRIITSATRERPTVTMVEDLHWLDPASGEFLEHMVDACAGTHSLLLVNFRPEYRAAWTQKSWYRQVPLTPLDETAVGVLLASLLGDDESIVALARPIHERTGGNAFFIEEVAQNLIEAGHLEGTGGDYRLVTPPDRLEVPATVNTILAARIDRLADGEKRLLQTASVIGKDFTERLLAAVADVDGEELKAALAVLCRGEFLLEKSIYPVVEYAFKHPLTQEVALGSLLKDRRRHVHAAVAGAIENQNTARLDERAALLAHHWEEAGEAWQAACWHKRAAEWAGVTNSAEGVRHWERVRALSRSLPQTREILELRVTACLGNLNLTWRLGTPMSEATAIFEEGRDLAQEAGDTLALSALHGTYAAAQGLVGGKMLGYLHHGREATRLAERTDDQGLQLAARSFLAWACLFSGRLSEGLQSCATVYERLPDNPTLGRDFSGYSPYSSILSAEGWMLARMGRLDEAAAICERGFELASSLGDVEISTWVRAPQVEIAASRGDAVVAWNLALRARETAEKSSTPQSLAVASISLGIAHRLQSEWADAVAVLDDAVASIVAGTNRMFESWVRSELSRSLLECGELDRAEREAQSAVSIAKEQSARSEEARAYIAVARTKLRRGGEAVLAIAENALGQSVLLIEETGAEAYLPELHECRAELARLRGDATMATIEIAEAQRLYSKMSAPLQVERLQRQLTRRPT
ncbi:MAG: class 3 adenylate cyclase/tetratricopeptide (TPR) repeat protein [Hyphomicrobiaceae bacterium]|jgi:class 3 adenylate cyclase/tetratricopeptide (TPR) repeat protein